MRDIDRPSIFYPITSQLRVWDTDVNHCCVVLDHIFCGPQSLPILQDIFKFGPSVKKSKSKLIIALFFRSDFIPNLSDKNTVFVMPFQNTEVVALGKF